MSVLSPSHKKTLPQKLKQFANTAAAPKAAAAANIDAGGSAIAFPVHLYRPTTVKILKIGTPEIITIIVLQLEQLDFKVQYCVQKMQTE